MLISNFFAVSEKHVNMQVVTLPGKGKLHVINKYCISNWICKNVVNEK